MKKRRVLLLFVAFATLLLAGCQKQDVPDCGIRFTAKSQPGVDTKTAYSGQTYTEASQTYERINWVVGDVIRMYSDKAKTKDNQPYADYTVSSIDNDNRYSQANLTGTGLIWGEELGVYHFWGIYPAHEMSFTGGTGTASGLAVPAVQDVIADNKTVVADATELSAIGFGSSVTEATVFSPDMRCAWMVADTPDVTEGASSFSMDFYPAFTAFQFSLASQFDATLRVKSFTLSSADTDIVGTFDASFAATGSSTYSNFSGSHDLTVSFGSGVDITNTKALRFTVLALPRDVSKLSISFGIEVNGTAVTRKLDLKVAAATTLHGHSLDAGDWIIFDACKKHEISGLVLPSGALRMSIGVAEWTVGAADYNYSSPVATSLKCLTGEKYRRYDTDSDYSTWAGSHIVASYGYKNDNNETIVTDDPAEFQIEEHTLLRPAYSPILELATSSDPSSVLELQLDNPYFKFIQYGTDSSGNIDLSVRDHTKADHLDIESGSGKKTFFSVVPVKQFAINATDEDKTCKVFLLSVSPGTIHEIPFNMTEGASPEQALPGEDMNELKFMYFGPAVYGSTGNLVTP